MSASALRSRGDTKTNPRLDLQHLGRYRPGRTHRRCHATDPATRLEGLRVDERLGNGAVDEMKRQASVLFTDMGLQDNALFSAWAAFEQAPEGTVKVALNSFEGRNPGGLFLFFIGRGEHKRAHLNGQRRTGWTRKVGSHSDSYHMDARGTDPLPTWYRH